MDRHAFAFLPPLDGGDVAPEIGGNLLPRIQPIFGRYSDRRSLPHLMPLGVLFGGLGIAAVGIASSYALVFLAIGGAVARLLGYIEGHPNIGFGILMLFVFFEFGFIAAAMLFAEPVLKALAWPAVLVANMLAATTMGGYFWLRHRNLSVSP